MTLVEPEAAVASLRAGDHDLAVTFGAGKQEDRFGEGVQHHHLLEDPMYLVLPLDHPLARKRGVRLADLAGEPWIGGAPDCECNRMISQACLRFGFDPRIAFETDDYAAVQGFVAAGVGVSLIAELGLRTLRDDIVVRPLGRDTPVRQIYATALTGLPLARDGRDDRCAARGRRGARRRPAEARARLVAAMSDASGRPVGSVARALALLDALAEGPAGRERAGAADRGQPEQRLAAARDARARRPGRARARRALPARAAPGRARRSRARPPRRARPRAAAAARAGRADGGDGDAVGARRGRGGHRRLPGGRVERREHGAARPPEHRPRDRRGQGAARVRAAASRPSWPPSRSARSRTGRAWPPSWRPCASAAGPRRRASASRTSTRSRPRSGAAAASSWRSSGSRARPRASRPPAAPRCCRGCSRRPRRSAVRSAAEPAARRGRCATIGP